LIHKKKKNSDATEKKNEFKEKKCDNYIPVKALFWIYHARASKIKYTHSVLVHVRQAV
jgi:hypothetical protein